MKKHLLALTAMALAATASAQTVDEITYEINPASGSQVEQISTFDITFNSPMKVDWPESVTILRNGVKTDAKVSCNFSEDTKTVTYTVTPALTEEGTYKIKYLEWSVAPAKPNASLETPHIELVYYIGEPQELSPVVTSNPEIGGTRDAITDFLLMFENVRSLEIDSSKRVYLTDGEQEWPYSLADESSNHEFMVMARPHDPELYLNKGGEYFLIIEDGALILNGKPYGYRLNYNIYSKLDIVSVSPAEGIVSVSQLENIDITLNMDIVSITPYMVQALQIYLVEDGEWVESVGAYKVNIDPDNRKLVHLTADGEIEITESGDYAVNIPPTLLRAADQGNLAWVLRYKVSTTGVDTVKANEVYNVYTIGGVRVVSHGNADALKNLAPGIYVINGKTTRIK